MQKANNKVSLAVISSIEKQFNVKFSYAVEDVAGITVEKPLVILRCNDN
jgi:hypothetical protein